MPQFLIEKDVSCGERVLLSEKESHHLRDLFRMKAGDTTFLTNGRGGRYLARVESIDKKGVVLKIEKELPRIRSNGAIAIGQALLKRDKIEWVIQKAAELGAKDFFPFHSSRTVRKFASLNIGKRWQQIADEALKQSGGSERMIVHPIISLGEFFKTTAASQKLIPWEEATTPIGEILQKSNGPRTFAFAIGPEGGFSGNEIEEAVASGFETVSLGPRVFRAETAAIAVASIIQYRLGNI